MKQLIGVGLVILVLGLMVGSTTERTFRAWEGEQYVRALAAQAYEKPVLLPSYSGTRVSVDTKVLDILGKATNTPIFLGSGSERMALGFEQEAGGGWLYYFQPGYYVIKLLTNGQFIVVDNNRFCYEISTGFREETFCKGATGPNTIGGLRHIDMVPQAPNHN